MVNKSYFGIIETLDTILSLVVLIFSLIIVLDVRNCSSNQGAGVYGDLIKSACNSGLGAAIFYIIILAIFFIALFVLVSSFKKGNKK